MKVRDTLYHGDTLTLSKDKEAVAQTQSHAINLMNLTFRSKVNVVSGSWMYKTYPLMEKNPYAKYGMLM